MTGISGPFLFCNLWIYSRQERKARGSLCARCPLEGQPPPQPRWVPATHPPKTIAWVPGIPGQAAKVDRRAREDTLS